LERLADDFIGKIWIRFIFNLKCSQWNFIIKKWPQSVYTLAQDYFQEQDFTERNLLQRGSNYSKSTWKSVKNMLSMKSCSWDTVNPGLKRTWIGAILSKFLYENYLKIKNKPNPENFKLRIYITNLSAGLPNLARLSL
jgi:hypothetical protein